MTTRIAPNSGRCGWFGLPGLFCAWMLISAGAIPANAACLGAGDFASSPEPSYQCAFGLEDWSVTTWNFQIMAGNMISVRAAPGPLPTMQGTTDCAAGNFSVTATVVGSCNVTYSLYGSIQSPGHWTGTFRAQYYGDCLDCALQTFAVEGTNSAVGVSSGATPEYWVGLTVAPNPTDGPTWFQFTSPGTQPVKLEVFDLLGRRLGTLVEGDFLAAGLHERLWNPRSAGWYRSGIRFARLTVGDRTIVRRFVVFP